MRKIIFLFIFLVTAAGALAQIKVLEDSPEDFSERKFGPNRQYFIAYHVGLGLNYTPFSGITTSYRWLGSGTFFTGVDYKLRLLRKLALAGTLDYKSNSFSGELESVEFLDQVFGEFDYWTFTFHQISMALGPRINIGRTGNTYGKYVEVGGVISYIFSNSVEVEGELISGESTEIMIRNPQLDDKWLPGFYARAGFHKVGLRYEYYPYTSLNTELTGPFHSASIYFTIY